MVRWLPLLILLIGTYANAEIYRWVDDEGVVHYSDKPAKDAKTVDLPEPTVVPATKPQKPPANITNTQEPQTTNTPPGKGYSQVKLLRPTPDETYQQGIPQVTIAVELSPPLQIDAGHRLRVLIDGAVVKSGLTASTTTVASPPHGSHAVSVEVMDGNKVLATAGPQQIHVLPRNNVQSPTNTGRAPRANTAPVAGTP